MIGAIQKKSEELIFLSKSSSCFINYQNPNQAPNPWTIAIGKNKAPAIKKPHLSSVKQINI